MVAEAPWDSKSLLDVSEAAGQARRALVGIEYGIRDGSLTPERAHELVVELARLAQVGAMAAGWSCA